MFKRGCYENLERIENQAGRRPGCVVFRKWIGGLCAASRPGHVEDAGNDQGKAENQINSEAAREKKGYEEKADREETRHGQHAGDEYARNEDARDASTQGEAAPEDARTKESGKQKRDEQYAGYEDAG